MIAVSWQTESSEDQKARAEKLSKELRLPLLLPNFLPTSLPKSKFDSAEKSAKSVKIAPAYEYILYVTAERLELRALKPDFKTKIFAEFLKGPLGFRRLRGGGSNQMIARAVGLKKNPGLTVLDATAGLGQDAFVLACLGCKVTLVERSPIIAALLLDGLERASSDPEVGAIVRDRMQVHIGEACEILTEIAKIAASAELRAKTSIAANTASAVKELPDVVYLDPMFPTSSKTALAKIEMRIIRAIVGLDEDAPRLLEAALQTAGHRVVVKRPAKSETLGNKEPNFVVEGSRNRYDVYLVK